MRDLLLNLAGGLRAVHRGSHEYGSMLDVVAGQNALRTGQLVLARQYFERATRVFEKLCEHSEDSGPALSDLMSTNACLIETLQRLVDNAGSVDSTYQIELMSARDLQSKIARRLGTVAA